MDRTFTDLHSAEAWLRWNGFTRYLGFWTWQTEDMTSTATIFDDDARGIEIFIDEREI